MSHLTAKDGYKSLTRRLNRFVQGAPPSETLYKILAMLFSEREAILVAQLPIKPFTIQTAQKIWGLSFSETEKILQTLASRAILLDMEQKGQVLYVLPPPMAGFFEFTLMRTGGHVDQSLLAELFHQYLNVEEDFVKALFFGTETKMGRVYVQEGVLSKDNLVEILDYEKASHIIKTSEVIGLSMCYCRHKAMHREEACSAPMDVCLTFGTTGASLSRHGYARKIDATEAMDVLQTAYAHNLVQSGENAQNGVSFICNCCGCCCEAMLAAKKFGNLHPVATTSFLPDVKRDSCNGCGLCAKACPIESIHIEDQAGSKTAIIHEEKCLGCGICVRVCHKKALGLKKRSVKIITPVSSVHRIVQMAIEKGQLADLIFDNKALYHHRAMSAILGAVLKLPPIKQIMASDQVKSVYFGKLLKNVKS